jgi:hypothetical protein
MAQDKVDFTGYKKRSYQWAKTLVIAHPCFILFRICEGLHKQCTIEANEVFRIKDHRVVSNSFL